MASYSLALTTSAEKELKRLPATAITRIVPRIEKLGVNPRPQGCRKLTGGIYEWRIRIGDYRVVNTIDDKNKTVEVTRIAHRRERSTKVEERLSPASRFHCISGKRINSLHGCD